MSNPRRAREELVHAIALRQQRGESLRAMSRAEEVSRKTVRRILQQLDERRESMPSDVPPKPRRAPRPSLLDPYLDRIDELLKEFPDIHITRLREILVSEGFRGGYTILRRHLAEHRPKAPKKAYERVETAPGLQAQVDWSPYTLNSSSPVKLYALSVVLGFSRYQYLAFCRDSTQATLFEHLRNAFELFGGVPEELVFDSMPGVVDRWEMGRPVINIRMLDFAAHYGFLLHIAPRRDPEYKGKVERTFRHLETSFFNGRKLLDFEHARQELRGWLVKTNERLHQGIRAKPVELWEQEEKQALRPLPRAPYDVRQLSYAIVDGYHHAPFDGNHYSVPASYVGVKVVLRASEHYVELYDAKAKLLAKHERLERGANMNATLPEHKRNRRLDLCGLASYVSSWSEASKRFVSELRKHKRYAASELSSISALQKEWALDDIIKTIEHATLYGAFDAASVERILRAKCKPRSPLEQLGEQARVRIQETLAQAPVQQRDLSAYQTLLAPSTTSTSTGNAHEEPSQEPQSRA